MNIKDSYIHGNLAVVRSIEGLSVGNNASTLILTYTKAEPLVNKGTESNPIWQQETYNVKLNNFSSYLDDKFVTLDTAQTVSGKKTFSNGIIVLNGLLFDKGGTSASDDVFHIDGISSYAGKIYLTGANASNSTNSTTQLVFQSGTTKGAAITSNGNNVIINQSESTTAGLIILLPGNNPYIKVNNNKVWHEGNDGAGSGLDADLLDGQHGSYYATASSLGNYLPLKDSNSYYPYIGSLYTLALTNAVIKVTLPSFTTSSNSWNMISMDIVLGGAYNVNTSKARIQLLYYIRYVASSGVFDAALVKAYMNGIIYSKIPKISYSITTPNIFYISNLSGYMSVAIENLSAGDSARWYNMLNIKLENIDSLPTGLTDIHLGYLAYDSNDYISSNKSIKATSFIGNASTATALTTDAGSSKIPVYFSGGKPVSTGYDLSTFLTITSAADTYLKLSGGTMTGSIGFKRNSTGGEARGLLAYGKNSDSISGGIGFLWYDNHEDEPYIYLATKTIDPWSSTNGLLITSSNITWKGNNVLTSSNVSGGGSSWGSSLTVDGKTLTIPSNPNTDYQVKQSNKTDNVYYPILLGGNYNATASNIATADKTSQVYQNSGVYVNASTKTIYASTFSGSFSGNSTTSTLTKYTLTSSAYHLVGVNENLTSAATARNAIGRNDVLVTASGAIQAVDNAGFNLGTSATMKYNTTNQSIDFIFN